MNAFRLCIVIQYITKLKLWLSSNLIRLLSEWRKRLWNILGRYSYEPDQYRHSSVRILGRMHKKCTFWETTFYLHNLFTILKDSNIKKNWYPGYWSKYKFFTAAIFVICNERQFNFILATIPFKLKSLENTSVSGVIT